MAVEQGGELVRCQTGRMKRQSGEHRALERIKDVEETFYDLMTQVIFLPNSPTLMNAGRRLGQLAAGNRNTVVGLQVFGMTLDLVRAAVLGALFGSLTAVPTIYLLGEAGLRGFLGGVVGWGDGGAAQGFKARAPGCRVHRGGREVGGKASALLLLPCPTVSSRYTTADASARQGCAASLRPEIRTGTRVLSCPACKCRAISGVAKGSVHTRLLPSGVPAGKAARTRGGCVWGVATWPVSALTCTPSCPGQPRRR